MRIEDITQARLKKLSNGTELHRLRGRFIQLYDRYFKLGSVKKAKGLERRMLLDRYVLLRAEMRRRGLKRYSETAIDGEVSHRLCRKAFLGIDTPGMDELILVPDYVSIIGSYITDPKKDTGDVDVLIRDSEDNRNQSNELLIIRAVKKALGYDEK